MGSVEERFWEKGKRFVVLVSKIIEKEGDAVSTLYIWKKSNSLFCCWDTTLLFVYLCIQQSVPRRTLELRGLFTIAQVRQGAKPLKPLHWSAGGWGLASGTRHRVGWGSFFLLRTVPWERRPSCELSADSSSGSWENECLHPEGTALPHYLLGLFWGPSAIFYVKLPVLYLAH